MPELERPEGARIHYEVRGEAGPLVVLSLGFAATPSTYEGLVADLARDHRVVTWEPRGCGSSSPDGPFNIATDAEDLVALIREMGPALAYAVGHGVDVTIRAVTDDPERFRSFVTPGIVTALREHLEGTEGFAASQTVTDLLVGQLRRDPRAAVRATVGSLNPQLDDDALRTRIDETLAYSSPETTLERIESWLTRESPLEQLRGLGDRLAVVWHEGDAWQAPSIPRVTELLPEARIVEVEDGPLSRPDLQAAIVREMT